MLIKIIFQALVSIIITIFLLIQLITTTINYLNFRSDFEMRIIDPFFGELRLVPIVIFLISATNDEYSQINIKKLDEIYENETNFDLLQREMKTLLDCRITNNGILEDCDSFYYSNLIINRDKSPEDDFELNQFFEMKYDLINGSFITHLQKRKDLVICLKYFTTNARNKNSYEQLEKIKKVIDRSYWKQKPFIQISTNSTKFSDYLLAFSLGESSKIGSNSRQFSLNQNKEYSITRISFHFLKFPYKSNCSHYKSSETIFKSISHEHCIRQCIRYHCEVKLNCSCFGINFKDYEIIDQLDYGFKTLETCKKGGQYLYTFTETYEKLCRTLCPIDCINDEYVIINEYKKYCKHSDLKYWNLNLYWDESKPIMIYEETPVMTFTEYFCYIGGLLGMWFGFSANQLFEKFIEKYQNFI